MGESEYGAEYAAYGGMGGGGGRSQFGRYVDAEGNPLPPGSTQPFAEFKMMPVRMRLSVDQRRLDKLLVNCANSDMPIKIVRVLIRPGQGTQTGGMMGGMSPMGTSMMGADYGGEGASYGMGEGYGAEYGGGGYGGGSGSGGASPMGAGTTQGQTGTHDVPVMIEGVIYIFNPPDISMLGKEGGRELASGQSLAPPETAPVSTGAEQPAEASGAAVPTGTATPAGAAPGVPAPQTPAPAAAPGSALPPVGAPPYEPSAAPPPGTPPAAAPPAVPPAAPATTGAPAALPSGTPPAAPVGNQP
ncbi:MAG: hypothetical protein ACUVQQ_06775 [Thermogutta sp.]